MASTFEWHRIAADINEVAFVNNIAQVALAGRTINIGRYQDQLFAFSATCPHAGAPLAGGRIDPAGNVVCPLHGYRFSIRTGRNTSGEGYHLKHWPVETRANGIYIRFEVV